MKPARFDLLRPTTVHEAVASLAEQPDDTVVLAGGQSLVPLMNMRFVVAERVLDLNQVGELDYVRQANGHLAVGAMTRHRTVERSELVASVCPLLPAAERHVGYVSIRNRGTVGGSIAHADTVAELTCVAVAIGATVVLTSVRGSRELPAAEFFAGTLMNSRESDELLTEVRFPVPRPGTTTGFAEFARKTGDFPLVTAAVQLDRDADSVTAARIAVGGIAPTPIRVTECEALVHAAEPSPDLLAEVAERAAAAVEPNDTLAISDAYRRELAGVVVREALEPAWYGTGDTVR